MNEKAKGIIQLQATLESEKSTLTNRWSKAVEYFLPDHGDVYGEKYKTTGEKRNYNIDSVGIEANGDLAAGLYSNTMSLSSQWFTARISDALDDESETVKNWLSKAAKETHRAFQNSNLAMMAIKAFRQLPVFGTAIVYSEFYKNRLNFRCFSPAEINIRANNKDEIDTVIRKYRFTARQAVQAFGESNVSAKLLETSNDPAQANTKYDFVHCVMPREGFNPDKVGGKNKRFASYHIECDEEVIVKEGGYDTMPYHVFRFYRNDESPWGSGPAMDNIGTMIAISKIKRALVRLIEKITDPPIMSPDKMAVDKKQISQEAGTLSYVNIQNGQLPFQFVPQGNPQFADRLLEQYKQDLKDAFFVDLFMDDEEKPNTTATEVVARREERMLKISPVISRLQAEFYTPLIERCIKLLMDNGVVSDPPEELRGKNYEIFYTSRIDSQFARVEMENTVTAYQQAHAITVAALEAPDLSQVVNIDKLIRSIFESYNVDPDVLHTEQETQQLREELQQRQEEVMQKQQEAESLKALKVDGMKAPEKGSPIEMIQGGVAV